MNSLPDTAEYWQRTLPAGPWQKKGICDCEKPAMRRAKSTNCGKCGRRIPDELRALIGGVK